MRLESSLCAFRAEVAGGYSAETDHLVSDKMRERLLVLEASWDDDFGDRRTVRPFIDGWAAQANIAYAYRAYNRTDDLRHWLDLFSRDPYANTLYIAGHGLGTRLVGLGDRGINIAALLIEVFKKTRGRGRARTKGLLVGACECFGRQARERILAATNAQLDWVAGYNVELPWLESTLIDLAFLQYRYRGRDKGGATSRRGMTKNRPRQHGTVATVSRWVCEDYPLAELWGFGVESRRRPSRR